MWNLVYKDIVQLRSQLLQMIGFVVLFMIAFGRSSPDFAMIYVYVAPVVLAVSLPQMSFGLEERGNTFAFLRALPIRPSEIVLAKYLVSVGVTLVFLGLIGLAGAAGMIPASSALLAGSVVALASFGLAGLSYFLHFLLGLKSARVALILVNFAWAIPIMLLIKLPGGPGAFVARYLPWLQRLAASWGGVGLASGLGLAVLGVSGAASAWLFTKRDLSRLP